MKLLVSATLAFGFLFAANAWAQGAPAEEYPGPRNAIRLDWMTKRLQEQKVEGDLDKEITDIKMRAHSGAKSKYSSSFSILYSGSSLATPLAGTKPSLGGSRVEEPASMSGIVGVRYRIDKNDSVHFSTGLNRPQPLQSSEVSQPTQISTPRIGYNKTFGWLDKQISSETSVYITTTRPRRAIGEIATLAYSFTLLNPIALTRFEGGVTANVWQTMFSDNAEYQSNDIRQRQNDSGYNLTPTLQYKVTDKFNIYTSIALFSYAHYRDNLRFFSYQAVDSTQTLGIGYAFSRDFYVSPSILFEPNHLSAENANYTISTRFNL